MTLQKNPLVLSFAPHKALKMQHLNIDVQLVAPAQQSADI
jgi:hypothetical protein